jgi:hypothetical protein
MAVYPVSIPITRCTVDPLAGASVHDPHIFCWTRTKVGRCQEIGPLSQAPFFDQDTDTSEIPVVSSCSHTVATVPSDCNPAALISVEVQMPNVGFVRYSTQGRDAHLDMIAVEVRPDVARRQGCGEGFDVAAVLARLAACSGHGRRGCGTPVRPVGPPPIGASYHEHPLLNCVLPDEDAQLERQAGEEVERRHRFSDVALYDGRVVWERRSQAICRAHAGQHVSW